MNDQIKNRFKSIHETYNLCLMERKASLMDGTHRKAVVVEFYNSITLHCKTCKRPELLNPEDYIVWKFQHKSQANVRTLDFYETEFNSEKFYLNFERDELTIFNAEPVDEGHYWCEIYNTQTSVSDYFVSVISGEAKRPLYENASAGSQLQFETNVIKFNKIDSDDLKVSIHWQEWSECSVCGRPGVKVRVGHCYLKSIDPQKVYNTTDLKIFEYYKNGLPCHSTLITLKLKKKLELEKVRSYIMHANCRVDCITTTTAGILGEKEVNITELKQLRDHSLVPKKDMFISDNKIVIALHGKTLRLRCITNNKVTENQDPEIRNAEITWTKDGNPITNLPNHIKLDENSNAIHFKRVENEDAGIYACFKKNTLIGLMKVKFSLKELKAFERIFREEFALYEQNLSVSIGSVVMVATFFLITFYAFFSRATRRKI